MYLPFATMPEHARLWIYQANRPFTTDERGRLETSLQDLCDQWQAHGAPLHTSFDIQHNQFVILAVDEVASGISGCSIDGSVRHLKNLQDSGLDFFDRTKVAFLDSQGRVFTHPLADLETLFENSTLLPSTLTFNNLVHSKAEWNNGWRVPVKDSWLARYLPKSRVA